MQKYLRLFLITLTIFFLSSCSIKKIVNPVKNVKIASLCIEQNDKVFVKEFITGLKDLTEEHGIATKVYQGEKPSECIYHMEYTAKWKWDIAMYLEYAKISIFENNVRIATQNTMPFLVPAGLTNLAQQPVK